MKAWASSFTYLSFDELESKTSHVVEARALDQRTEFGRDGSLETYIRFETLDVLKGKAASEFELVIPGGSKDGVEYQIVGFPSFKAGASYVLFLEQDPGGFFQIQEAQSGVIQIMGEDLASPLALPVQKLHALKENFRARSNPGALQRERLSQHAASENSTAVKEAVLPIREPRPLDLTQFWILVGLLGLVLWFLQGKKRP